MRVLIRADASVSIGSGHVMRCLTLANQLRGIGAYVVFVCRDLPGSLFQELEKQNYPYVKLPPVDSFSQKIDAEETIEAVKKFFSQGLDWLIVDHYALDREWEYRLRSYTNNLMVIDDLANRPHDCDLLLDQNYYENLESRYQSLVPEHCVALLGPAYVLLRPEFVEARKNLRIRDGIVRRILVFFGGSDPTNQTSRVVQSLYLLNQSGFYVDVVVGAANAHREQIEYLCSKMPGIVFHYETAQMAQLVELADLAIGAGGSAMWERCCLGLPALTVVFAENQQRTTEDVAKTGAIQYLGWIDQLDASSYAKAIQNLIDNPQQLSNMTDASIRLFSSQLEIMLPQIMFSLATDGASP